ncbi:hypothetical protein CCS41_11055 [Candidatus Fukatsuia symbiotica]|uniref:Fimbrial assembly protein n=1 Tax=Candidatus Fukatsuia symbiotica TaxID=1878942 RepID=A0A2U8I6W3_9GAMM|nr:hypothetical protein CCS41_11055 [Candidatus Fukatsuia symbiotica]
MLLATQQGAEHLERIKARRRNHQKIQHQTYNYLILLQRLSRLIPDSCWLIKLEQHDDLLVLAGIGNNYTTIIAFLQKLVAEDNLFNIQLHNLNQQKKGELHFVIHVKGLYKMYNLQEKLRDE